MPFFVDTSPPGHCIFCRLVNKEIPAAIVFEDDQTLAFMDLGQVNPGHVLVASKRHAATLLDLSAGTLRRIRPSLPRCASPHGAHLPPPPSASFPCPAGDGAGDLPQRR